MPDRTHAQLGEGDFSGLAAGQRVTYNGHPATVISGVTDEHGRVTVRLDGAAADELLRPDALR